MTQVWEVSTEELYHNARQRTIRVACYLARVLENDHYPDVCLEKLNIIGATSWE